MDLRVGKSYQLQKKIGSGAFGEIFEGNCLIPCKLYRKTHLDASYRRHQTSKQLSFFILCRSRLKPNFPNWNTKTSCTRYSEVEVSRFSISDSNFAVGIPEVYWFGVEGDYKCLVMEICGKSLEDLF
jgi:casein kinase I family protein HRR25